MPLRARDRDELEVGLLIDEDDLDQCLVDQAEYFYQVSKQVAMANDTHAVLELQLKELSAELSQDIRRRATDSDEKVTETALANQLRTLPRIKDLSRKVLQAKKAADDWTALERSYQQRSYSLRSLNESQIARYYNLAVERGSTGPARRNLADRNRAEAEQLRRERYRPRNNAGD